MRIEEIPIIRLVVNRANDRHAELANEQAAIAELFRLREQHMRTLAADIVNAGRLFELPLVWPLDENFIVHDGNRRVTCIKLLVDPQLAPTHDLQGYFDSLRSRWDGALPELLECEVEDDRDVIDEILFRRHTGSQGGVGRSDWDNRAKRNFIERTGRGGRLDLAVEVERLLEQHHAHPASQIPRSTLNRLLSSEANRNRVGISLIQNRFSLTHQPAAILPALRQIASDLAEGQIVLGDLWDNEGKRAYLNRLEANGLLPGAEARLAEPAVPPRQPGRRPGRPVRPRPAQSLIPMDAPAIPWNATQGRIRSIWDELSVLSMHNHPNAVSALLRILVELVTTDYIVRAGLQPRDALGDNLRIAAQNLRDRDVIDQAYFDELNRMRQDELISIRSMQRYIHSHNFAPMPAELQAYWIRLGRYLVAAATD